MCTGGSGKVQQRLRLLVLGMYPRAGLFHSVVLAVRIRRTGVSPQMSTSGARYVVMTVECRHCKTKQTVHVAAGVGMTAKQIIRCINCKNYFDVMLPDKIVGGPFPKR